MNSIKIFLGGHLNFYHPNKEKWLEVEIFRPTNLVTILNEIGVPQEEIYLVVLNGENIPIDRTVLSANDEVKLFPAVGGG